MHRRPSRTVCIAAACRACGIAKQQDWPVAPWLARAAGIDPGGAYWLCAEPSRFIVGQSDVRLGGLIRDLDAADANELVAMLNAHFAGDRIAFVAPTPARWFARAEPAPRLRTRPPEAAFGAPLTGYLAAGPDGARWRGWQNELQMLLFEHAVNRRRETNGRASVDSVWFWGGGTRAEPTAVATRIFATDGLVCALGRSAGIEPAPLPATFEALPTAPARLAWLGALDADSADAQLSALDSAWCAPAERALRAGRIGEVELLLGGRALTLGWRVSRPSLAQRWRRLFVRTQASPLLARWVAEATEH